LGARPTIVGGFPNNLHYWIDAHSPIWVYIMVYHLLIKTCFYIPSYPQQYTINLNYPLVI
jgi:hypothetical protein